MANGPVSATTTTAPDAPRARVPEETISVPSAESLGTTPNPAPTPDVRATLTACDILHQFGGDVSGIREGFRLGMSNNHLTSSLIPHNHRSALNNPNIIKKYIQKELSASRYFGPLSFLFIESSLGLFRSSPLGSVPEAGSTKMRIIQYVSYPHGNINHPSVNSEIDIDSFP